MTKKKAAPKKKEKIDLDLLADPREPGVCPACGSDELDFESILIEDFPGACYPFVCTKCNATGREYYNLHFVEIVLDSEEEK